MDPLMLMHAAEADIRAWFPAAGSNRLDLQKRRGGKVEPVFVLDYQPFDTKEEEKKVHCSNHFHE